MGTGLSVDWVSVVWFLIFSFSLYILFAVGYKKVPKWAWAVFAGIVAFVLLKVFLDR